MASSKTKMAAKSMPAADDDGAGRFLDVDVVPRRMLMAIEGYQNRPLVSLEEAVAPLLEIVPTIGRKADQAKEDAKREKTESLPIEQHAAIKLYTMEWSSYNRSLYYCLNEALRDEDRDRLKPWFLYLKLLLTALLQLPSTSCKVFRGMKKDLRNEYPAGTHVLWWGFSSCTSDRELMRRDRFLGSRGPRTLFSIEARTAKDIVSFSRYRTERELLLLPARQFEVLSCRPHDDGLVEIHMKEISESLTNINLLDPVRTDLLSPYSTRFDCCSILVSECSIAVRCRSATQTVEYVPYPC